jgi:hypothetical protein
MKKTALAVAICGSLGFSAAHAATVSEFANGVLVPYVIDGGAGNQTAIGLTSCAAGTVYWTFFNVNSDHEADGTFNMSQNDQVNIVWGTAPENIATGQVPIGGFVRPDLANVPGYMVFILDDGGLDQALDSSDSPCLAGNAFQIDTQNNDVAFTPALPLDAAVGDFGAPDQGVYVSNLILTDEDTVAGLNAGANFNDDIYLRYFIDGVQDSGNDTIIYIWNTGDASGTETVLIYDIDQNFFSINLALANTELNIVDVENNAQVQNRPSELLDGFILWTVPAAAGDAVSWSRIESDAFGAAQTVMNPIRQLNESDRVVYRVKVQQPAAIADLDQLDPSQALPSYWLVDPNTLSTAQDPVTGEVFFDNLPHQLVEPHELDNSDFEL